MANLNGKKVLIIEDDTLLHNLLAGKLAELRKEGVEIFPVFNAEEGLKIAREHKPDLVLLDLMLPGMTGFEFLDVLRKDDAIKTTPVIVFSNLSSDEDKAKARTLGAIDFLVKADFSLDEISQKITSVLNV